MSETTVYVNGRPVEVPDGTYRAGDGPRVIVRFAGPIRTAWPDRLAKLGATVEFWCPPYGACVTVAGDAAERLSTSGILAGYVPYDESFCDRALDPGVPLHWLDVICFSHADRPRVADELRALGAEVLDESGSKIRID